MKTTLRILSLAAAIALITPALAVDLLPYQPGPRLIDGSQLNQMVDVVNTLQPAAGGAKSSSGETALDASNPTPVTTGLTSITQCQLTIKGTATPGVDTSVVTYSTSGGTLSMYAWKVTSSVNNTLIASTGTQTIGWYCTGS